MQFFAALQAPKKKKSKEEIELERVRLEEEAKKAEEGACEFIHSAVLASGCAWGRRHMPTAAHARNQQSVLGITTCTGFRSLHLAAQRFQADLMQQPLVISQVLAQWRSEAEQWNHRSFEGGGS